MAKVIDFETRRPVVMNEGGGIRTVGRVSCPGCGRTMSIINLTSTGEFVIFPHQFYEADDDITRSYDPVTKEVDPPYFGPECPGSSVRPTKH